MGAEKPFNVSNIIIWYSMELSIRKINVAKHKRLHRPGIEPGPPAWQARILPLNQRCSHIKSSFLIKYKLIHVKMLSENAITNNFLVICLYQYFAAIIDWYNKVLLYSLILLLTIVQKNVRNSINSAYIMRNT